jgi:hypothetical protein
MIEPQLISTFQKGFGKTCRLMLSRSFAGVFLDSDSHFGPGRWPQGDGVFFYASHSTWWDPVIAGFLAVELMGLKVIAPMAEDEYKKRLSLKFVGVFGVREGDGPEVESLIQKLKTREPKLAVWVTPQGTFYPNELPQPKFKSGLSRWSRMRGSVRIPVSAHLQFTTRSKPDLFLAVGAPILGQDLDLESDSSVLRSALDEQNRRMMNKIYKAATGSRFDSTGFEKLLGDA